VPELLGEEAVIDELPASLAGCSDGASSAWLYFYKYVATYASIQVSSMLTIYPHQRKLYKETDFEGMER
jgi:hypothetical protein